MTFKAAVTPTLTPDAQRLVDIYNNTYGSCGPGCNPAGLAAVLDELVDLWLFPAEISTRAAQLRGESQ